MPLADATRHATKTAETTLGRDARAREEIIASHNPSLTLRNTNHPGVGDTTTNRSPGGKRRLRGVRGPHVASLGSPGLALPPDRPLTPLRVQRRQGLNPPPQPAQRPQPSPSTRVTEQDVADPAAS